MIRSQRQMLRVALIGFLALLGCALLLLGTWGYMGHGPKRVNEVGVLKYDGRLAVFSCAGRGIAEAVVEDRAVGGDLVWRATKLPRADARAILYLEASIDGYEVVESVPVGSLKQSWVTLMREPPRVSLIDNVLEVMPASLSDGSAMLHGGETVSVRELQRRHPDCGLGEQR